MKRKILAIMTVFSLLILVSGCQDQTKETAVKENRTIKIGGLKGPTSMGMVKLMDDAKAEKTKYPYEFTISATADEVTPKLIKGELDMAAVPANLSSVLYNNSDGAVVILAINTLGVVYIVDSQDSVSNVQDLKGKTIYATGKGTAPEYTLSYILSKNGIDRNTDVNIEWKSEPAEVVALLKEKPDSLGMLPQPFVTVAQSNIKGLNIALDLTKEWEAVDDQSTCITGVLVANKKFVKDNPEKVEAFLEEYHASAVYANESPAEASQLIESYDIVKSDIAQKALPYCNITYIDGSEMKQKMQGYLEVLYNQEPKSIGGALPDDAFYYEK